MVKQSMQQRAGATVAELDRLREVYNNRDAAMPGDDRHGNIYHPRHRLGRLFRRHNTDVLIDALNALQLELGDVRALDVGCGSGHWLRQLVELGADPARLAGVDLSGSRINQARQLNPAIRWEQGDSTELPFETGFFDLVLQVVVFSSVLDGELRRQMAAEMARVLGVGGHLLWLDKRRPEQDRLAGFERDDVRALFPEFSLRYARPVHPLYFRWLGGRLPTVAETFYRITTVACESWLLVLRKEGA